MLCIAPQRVWEAIEAEVERNLNRAKKALEEYSDEAIMHDEDLLAMPSIRSMAMTGPQSHYMMSTHGLFITYLDLNGERLGALKVTVSKCIQSFNPRYREGRAQILPFDGRLSPREGHMPPISREGRVSR